MRSPFRPRPSARGHRVAHRHLDDPRLGTARVGVATETFDDDSKQLVAARFEDVEGSHEEAFLREELVDLGPAGLSRGPVLLYPRHLWALLRRPSMVAAMLLALALGVVISVVAENVNWSLVLVACVVVPVAIAFLLLGRLLESRVTRRVSARDEVTQTSAEDAVRKHDRVD